MKAMIVGIGLVVALAATCAFAQDVKIERRPPAGERRPEIQTPSRHYEQTRPSDHDWYPEGPRVETDPAFVEGLSSEYEAPTSSGRVGVAGWTAPATPVGPAVAGYREIPGWLTFGFAVTWGGPPARVAHRPAPPPAR